MGVPANTLVQKGLPASDILSAGYPIADLKAAGFTPSDLRTCLSLIAICPAFTLGELLLDGVLLSEVVGLGQAAASFSPQEPSHDLQRADPTCMLRFREQQANHAWFRAQKAHPRILQKIGLSPQKGLFRVCDPSLIVGAGYTLEEVWSAGLRHAECKALGFTATDFRGARGKGMTVSVYRPTRGSTNGSFASTWCETVDASSASGMSAWPGSPSSPSWAELRLAGYSAAELFASRDVPTKITGHNSSWSVNYDWISGTELSTFQKSLAEDLRAAGFTAAELNEAGVSVFYQLGITALDARRSGASLAVCETIALAMGGPASVVAILLGAGVSAVEVASLQPSYVTQLRGAGTSASELIADGVSAKNLLQGGFSATDLRACGVSPQQLLSAGCPLKSVAEAGFSFAELKASGVSVAILKAADYTAATMCESGVDISELLSSFSPAELKEGGYSAQALRGAGVAIAQLLSVGYAAIVLRREAGASAAELKAAGLSASSLRTAGYSAADLKNACCTAADMKQAGFSLADVEDHFKLAELRAAGFLQRNAAGGNAQQDTCSICWEKPRSTAFQCGHASFCDTCAAGLQTCPLCRATVQTRTRIFL